MASNQFNNAIRQLQQQLRQAEQQERRRIQAINEYNRKVAQHNREVARQVNEHNRRVNEHNRQLANQIDSHNRAVSGYNREVESNNRNTLSALRSAATVRYTPSEAAMVDRVREALEVLPDGRPRDIFLSYARLDGAEVATALRDALEGLDVSVWFDEVAILPGKSMSRQMDAGLTNARAGVVVLTPAYVTGRFWTERELGVLLHKDTVIPVLHSVTFDDVATYSGMLGDLAGFTTATDDIPTIAAKIAEAVCPRRIA